MPSPLRPLISCTLALVLLGTSTTASADPDDRIVNFDALPGGEQPVNGAPVRASLVGLGVAVASEGSEARFKQFSPSENGSRPFGLGTDDDLRSAVVLRLVKDGRPDEPAPRSRVSLSILSLGRSRVEIVALDAQGDPVEGLEAAVIDGTSGTLGGDGPWERQRGESGNLDLLGLGYVDRVTFEGALVFAIRIHVTAQAPSDAIFIDDLSFALDNCPEVDNEAQIDLDGDGFGDECDGDDDGDGVQDEDDNCPGDPNADQRDTDMDGRGDECSVDPDQDGIVSDFNDDGRRDRPCRTGQSMFCDDNCPRVSNQDQRDGDEDGLGNVCDPDIDGDGFANEADTCPESANTNQDDRDGDGLGDLCDPDIDDDGVVNLADNCPNDEDPTLLDTDSDATGDVCDEDDDNDAIPDVRDNCPFIANPDQPDDDRDGVGDECDDDADNDAVVDEDDNCPEIPNPAQADLDTDALGDECDIDDDDDGLDDFSDNCPEIPNEDQRDINNDGIGDACQADPDGDSFTNTDNCPQTFNPDQADANDDGIGDACAPPPLPDDGKPGCQCAVHAPSPASWPTLAALGLLLLGVWVGRRR